MLGISIGVDTPGVLDREAQPSAVWTKNGVIWRDPTHQKDGGLCQRQRGRLDLRVEQELGTRLN